MGKNGVLQHGILVSVFLGKSLTSEAGVPSGETASSGDLKGKPAQV